jgi:hypothetical protein
MRGNEGKPNELGNDRGMRGNDSGMRGEWGEFMRNRNERGMTVEWENSSYQKKKTQIYNSYHKLIWLSSYEKKNLF